jgi:hypothetical protein
MYGNYACALHPHTFSLISFSVCMISPHSLPVLSRVIIGTSSGEELTSKQTFKPPHTGTHACTHLCPSTHIPSLQMEFPKEVIGIVAALVMNVWRAVNLVLNLEMYL